MVNRTSNYHALKFTQVLDPVVSTGNGNTTETSYVDLQGYDECLFAVALGTTADTLSGSLKFDFVIQHSDTTTGGDFADASSDDIINPVSGASDATFAVVDDAAEDNAVYLTAYRGNKRYVRLQIERTGNHATGTPLAVLAIRGRASAQPTV